MDTTRILITGDYCPIGRNKNTIERAGYNDLFGGFERYSNSADISITNLEAPITEATKAIEKTGPALKVSTESLLALKYAGFNVVTLANNHIMDYGSAGLKSTIKACIDNDIAYVGAGANLTEARQPYFCTHGGKQFAIINVAENEFCTTTGDEYGANPLDTISNYYDIKHAKSRADFVIVISHGGREHYQLPTPKQRDRFRFFIDSGADIVVGHHTHCSSGYEIYAGKPIFYSLGNFLFDYKRKYQRGLWTQGFGVLFEINTKWEINFKLIPFFQGRSSNAGIVLLEGQEQEEFEKSINVLNQIIVDDKKFAEAWLKYINSQERSYKAMLFIQNRYVRALISKRLLPPMYFHSSDHKTLLLNLLKCETHREIMINVLDKKLP